MRMLLPTLLGLMLTNSLWWLWGNQFMNTVKHLITYGWIILFTNLVLHWLRNLHLFLPSFWYYLWICLIRLYILNVWLLYKPCKQQPKNVSSNWQLVNPSIYMVSVTDRRIPCTSDSQEAVTKLPLCWLSIASLRQSVSRYHRKWEGNFAVLLGLLAFIRTRKNVSKIYTYLFF